VALAVLGLDLLCRAGTGWLVEVPALKTDDPDATVAALCGAGIIESTCRLIKP